MSGETIRTADGRLLTEVEAAVHKGIADRLSWASLHWGTESVSPDAWPHIAIAATSASEAAVRAQIAAEIEAEIEAVLPPSIVTLTSAMRVGGIRDGLHMAADIARAEP